MSASFDQFFKAATGKPEPYDYQCRLACGPDANAAEPKTLRAGAVCQSQLISIPTGLGKTAAVVLAWLWNRVVRNDDTWPRRLVYCLPMRTLVEQTRDSANVWIDATLNAHAAGKLSLTDEAVAQLKWLHEHSPVILMGGEDLDRARRDWDLFPERPAILIGTQDMLISRALNRGYGMSRYRWPMHFALLNNDCLWVVDEPQLMGVSVESSAQLDGFRCDAAKPPLGPCTTWWMSATLDPARLATVDHRQPADGWPTEHLNADERRPGSRPHALVTAKKRLMAAPLKLSSTTAKDYPAQLAKLVVEHHQAGSLTLVVLNRVARARAVFRELTSGKRPLYAPEKVALIHSRFRPADRERHLKLLTSAGDRIVIATQAIEAGVDVSARLLITELAPWSSLVQRFGRCNRYADHDKAEVLWIDIVPDTKGDLVVPYTADALARAREAIVTLADASPHSVGKIDVPEIPVTRPVIRRRDLVDLFDTTPDLCGQDLDIARYIRDEQDNDVQFFWRTVASEAPEPTEPPPVRNELCRVSIGDAAKFLDRETTEAWSWDPLARAWIKATTARPGRLYLIKLGSGGYGDAIGWTGDAKDQPSALPSPALAPESMESEGDTFIGSWQTIAEHTGAVVQEVTPLASLARDAHLESALCTAALWHDVGKAHEAFQRMLRGDDASRANQLWAKSAHHGGKCPRPGFRHELASALAWLLSGPADDPDRDLVAYLIAAHHGKVRLSIRSLPNETGDPDQSDALFARGIHDGDRLPGVSLNGLTTPETHLDLSLMRLGTGPHGPSWLARMIALRDTFGPFRLAYLETLLRAADARASRNAETKVNP